MMLAAPLLDVATTCVGASGTEAGVTLSGCDATLEPTLLVATTTHE